MLFRTPAAAALTLVASCLLAACEAPVESGSERAEVDSGAKRDTSPRRPPVDPNSELLVRKVTICAKTLNCTAPSGTLQLKVSTRGAPENRGCATSVWFGNERIEGGAALEDQYACQSTQSELDLQTGRYIEIRLAPSPPLAAPDPLHRFEPSAEIDLSNPETCTTLPLVDVRDASYPAEDDRQRKLCADYAREHSLPADAAAVLAGCKLIVQARYVYPAGALTLDGLTLEVGGQKVEATLDSVDFGRASAQATFDCRNPKPAKSAAARLNELMLRESVRQLVRPPHVRAQQARFDGHVSKRLRAPESASKHVPVLTGAAR